MSLRLLPLVLAAVGLAACNASVWRSDYRAMVPAGAVAFRPGDPATGPLTLDGAAVGDITFAALDKGVFAYQYSPAPQRAGRPVFVQVSCGEGLVRVPPFPSTAASQDQIARCADSPVVAKALYKPD